MAHSSYAKIRVWMSEPRTGPGRPVFYLLLILSSFSSIRFNRARTAHRIAVTTPKAIEKNHPSALLIASKPQPHPTAEQVLFQT